MCFFIQPQLFTMNRLKTAILALGALSAAAQTNVHWQNLGNTTDPQGKAQYTQRFTVSGDSDFSRLAFNMFARGMELANPADTLIELVPGYYAVASPRFAAAKGQPVDVDITTRGTLRNICYTPDGVHIVRADGSTAPVVFTRRDLLADTSFYALPGSNKMPTGEWLFERNAKRTAKAEAGPYDVIPSFKSVTLKDGVSKLSPSVSSLEIEPVKDQREGFFRLTVKDNKAVLETNNPLGAIWRIMPLLESGKPLPNAVTEDWPDFQYRGLMIDVARNFLTPKQLGRVIDLMARYGLNTLHFHFTDDEAWRLEIPGLPELTSLGSRRGYTADSSEFLPQIFAGDGNPDTPGTTANGHFTRREFIDMLRYADSKGIRVVPEVESPGHARAAIYAMEKRFRDTGDDTFRLIDPADTSKYSSAQAFHDDVMNPAIPGPVNFMTYVASELQKMYREAGLKMPALHIGGDEVAMGAWRGSPLAQAYMKEHGITNERDLHLVYVRQLLDNLREMGIPVSGWQEIAVGHDDEYNNAVRPNVFSVNCWSTLGRNGSVTEKSTRGGYPTVLSNVNHYYLDMMYSNHPYERGLNWGGTVDEFDALHGYPRQLCPVDDEAFKNVIGVSGHVFGETLRSDSMLESFLLPKMLGLAERAWNSDSTYTDEQFNAIIESRELPFWKAEGYNYHVAQPGVKVVDGLVEMNSPYIEAAEIRYTTDGTEPTAESQLYIVPIRYEPGMKIRAKAFVGDKSSVSTLLY